jgi:hypothetical protein
MDIEMSGTPPKFMPHSVSMAPPVFAAFDWTTTVITGASHVNPSMAVPTSNEIVTDAFARTDIMPEFRHLSEVDVVHDAVAQSVPTSLADADGFVLPKFVPLRITKFAGYLGRL